MDHISQYNWCFSQPDLQFLRVEDIENSVTEKILRNKFRDPLISSSDSDDEKPSIDWEKIFTEKQAVDKFRRLYVPGLRQVPQYPKVSAITQQQHYQCMKVLCHQNPNVLELEFMPRPTKGDFRVFEEIKATYEKEQKEYQEWAKSLWLTSHCTRALRPKPPVETTYEARFNMKAHEFVSYPSNYKMAAQIPLDFVQSSELIHDKDLISVNIKDLPQIRCEPLTKHQTIMKHIPVPEPCNKHKCKFVLPNEKSVTELPLTEVQRELAQYAADNNAQIIATESALRCLVELDHSWMLPVAVCEVFGPDGDTKKVVVLGSDFAMQKESVLVRTYKAFKLLLEHFLIPPSERGKLLNSQNETKPENVTTDKPVIDTGSSDDEDNNMLCIDEAELQMDDSDSENNLVIDDMDPQNIETEELNGQAEEKEEKDKETNTNVDEDKSVKHTKERIGRKQNDKPNKDEFYNCCCKDTQFEMPPRRSYRRWQLRSDTDTCHIIVHCSHRLRDESGEVVVEPIPEYQIDVGASELSSDRSAALALALRLRPAATLLTVRVDNATGDVISYERRRPADADATAARLHSAVTHLTQLNTGHYVLKHEPSHGANALLYATCGAGAELSLVPQRAPQPDDAAQLRVPPTLAPVLLPVHKFRKQLPCAFSPYEKQVKPPRPQPRQKTPPQAIKLDTGTAAGGNNKVCRKTDVEYSIT
ncbi:uncharacterized protein LOC121729173 isoform X1 [Aricia agestis]|uniref:uncharacterized protein LOC121729173 isoform X1 n=1 Tax=Aricia agestis TaxID=91739 RepID=UPI001C2086D6|nr:uncharacterized protein LOC121729173 isoform X1 [Aricia agestis]